MSMRGRGGAVLALLLALSCGGDKREESRLADTSGENSTPILKGDIAPPKPPKPPKQPKPLQPKPSPSAAAELPGAALGASIDACEIAGARYAGPCKSLRDIRIARHGQHVYLSRPGDGVRRFTGASGPACRLELDKSFGAGGLVAFPAAKPTGQSLGKGTLTLSSGGPSYKLAVSPTGEVVVFDFTRGVHRIAGPGPRVSCPERRGVIDVLFAQGRMYTAGFTNVHRMTMSKGCPQETVSLSTKDMTISRIGVWGKRMIVAGSAKTRRGKIVRLMEAEKVALQLGNKDPFAPDGMCWVSGAARCGDGLCVLDGNCRTLKRFDADGTLRGSMKLGALLDRGLYASHDLHRDPEGALWLALSQRDSKTDTCTLRTYRLRF